MKKALLIASLVVAALVAAFVVMRLRRPEKPPEHLVLYGNVDLRQIELAFNNNERIAEVLVQEGDKVRKGQVLARLDTSRLRPQEAEMEGTLAAQQVVVLRLHNGSRPEEIAQAQANVALAKADLLNAEEQWKRVTALSKRTTGLAVSRQDVDNAKAALDMAQAKLAVAEKTHDLTVAGPRKEDIAQGEAQLRANEARLQLLRRELADADLIAPADTVVRRLSAS